MKSLRQSRLDRLARRAKEKAEEREKEYKLTPKQRSQRNKKFTKQLLKVVKKLFNEKCPHGNRAGGRFCLQCRPDEIANQLREKWNPAPSFNLEVIPVNADEVYIPVTIKSNHITQTITNMQKNGFWYLLNKEPIFMMPEGIRCIIVKDMAQNPSSTDPEKTPLKEVPGMTLFAQQ